MGQPCTLYHLHQADPDLLQAKQLAVLGYGNQGRAQALNLRDSGFEVTVANRRDEYRNRAEADGFPTLDIPEAVRKSDILFLLVPDERLPGLFDAKIRSHLQPGTTLVFASGYTIAFALLEPPPDVDVVLLAPRMIGVGVRERFLSGEGFYCLVGVHQDASGEALARLLALTQAIGGLTKPAIEVSFKQEALLDLFNEQGFGPAFGRVLLSAIQVMLEAGLPPEAVLVEMLLSEEMAYTYRQMARVGLVRQTLFHSQTSQYGAMSRGIRFLGMGVKARMERIFRELEEGSFAREWASPLSRLKFRAIRFLAMRQSINRVETAVRRRLGLPEAPPLELEQEGEGLLEDPRLQEELEPFYQAFEF